MTFLVPSFATTTNIDVLRGAGNAFFARHYWCRMLRNVGRETERVRDLLSPAVAENLGNGALAK